MYTCKANSEYDLEPVSKVNDRNRPHQVVAGMRKEPAIILRGHATPVTALHFLRPSESPYLLSGDDSGQLHLWDLALEEGEVISSGTKSPILNILSRNETLYVHYKSGLLTRGPIDCLSPSEDSFTASKLTLPFAEPISFCRMRLIGDHCVLFPGPDASAALLADTRAGLLPCGRFTNAKAGMLTAVVAAEAGAFLASYENGTVARWEMRYDKAPTGVAKVAADALFALACSPRGRVAVAGGGVDTVSAVAETEAGGLRVLRSEKLRQVGVGDAAWRPDCRVVATAGWDGRVRVWSGKRSPTSLLRPLASLRWHARSVQRVVFSHDSTWLASGGSDCTIALWDVFQAQQD